MEKLMGSTPDISSLLCFCFWEPVYYRMDDSDFPSEPTEKLRRFVGIFENVGHIFDKFSIQKRLGNVNGVFLGGKT